MTRMIFLLSCWLLCVVSTSSRANEAVVNPRAKMSWNEFRGPGGSGVAAPSDPPVEIESSHATWRTAVPTGHSSPVLSESLVILTGVEQKRLVTIALQQADGALVWKQQAPEVPLEPVHETSSPAASTPFVDGSRIYVYFGSYGLLCYDLSGNLIWQRALPTPKSLYGCATSPIVSGDQLIVVLDSDDNLSDSTLSQSKILAVNKHTGETIWESPRPLHRSSWSTPTIWTHDDQHQELVVLGSSRVCGYDLKTGEEKWSVGGFSRETIARPIVVPGLVLASASMLGGVADEQPDPEPFWKAVMRFDANGDGQLEKAEMVRPFTFPLRPDLPSDHPGFGIPLPDDEQDRQKRLDGVFVSVDKDRDGRWSKDEFLANLSFDRGKPNLLAIKPGGQGDVSESHVAWAVHRGIPETPTPLYHDGRIYLICDGGILTALNANDGRTIYRQRLGTPGHYRASPVLAGDRIYFASEEGVVSVVQAGDTFRLLHQVDLHERIAATPALDERTIYLRTESALMAFRK